METSLPVRLTVTSSQRTEGPIFDAQCIYSKYAPSPVLSFGGRTLIHCPEFRGCPYLRGEKIYGKVIRGHMVCLLYGGRPYLRGSIRVYAGIMRQSILWDTHTNKCGSCRLLGHCIVSYWICHLLNCIHYPLFLMWVYAYFVLK